MTLQLQSRLYLSPARQRDTNRKSSSYFHPRLRYICGADFQTSDFHIDLGHAEAGAELGNPDTAAIRGLKELRGVPVREAELSLDPSGPNLQLVLPSLHPGRDL